MGFFLWVASIWAGPASIQGIVKDAKGHPIKGADVRIESKDGSKLLNARSIVLASTGKRLFAGSSEPTPPPAAK